MKSSQVKSSQVKSSQVKSSQVKIGIAGQDVNQDVVKAEYGRETPQDKARQDNTFVGSLEDLYIAMDCEVFTTVFPRKARNCNVRGVT